MTGSADDSARVSYRPSPALRPFVRRVVGYRMADVDVVHRGLPSTELTFVVALDRPLTVGWSADPQCRRPYWAMVSGMHTAPAYIFPDSGRLGVQLDLTPAGVRSLFGLPAAALHAAIVDLPDVAGRVGAELAERTREAAGWPARFAALDRELLRMVGPDAEIRSELRWAWRQLVHSRTTRTDPLADEIGWSRGYFARMFAAEFGLRPKETARVVRFDRARRAMAAALVTAAARNVSGTPDCGSLIADTAYAQGYADQAHLTREWSRLAGCTPVEWQREVFAFVQAAPG